MWFHVFSFKFLGVELENETKQEESRWVPSSRGIGLGGRIEGAFGGWAEAWLRGIFQESMGRTPV